MKAEHLERYQEIASLLWKYGRSDLARLPGLEIALDAPDVAAEQLPKAEELTAELERMGPTFVKVGQLLSTRADLLPPPYLAAARRS